MPRFRIFMRNLKEIVIHVCYSKSYYHSPCPQIIKLHKNLKYLKFDIICLLPPLNALCIMWTRNQNNARHSRVHADMRIIVHCNVNAITCTRCIYAGDSVYVTFDQTCQEEEVVVYVSFIGRRLRSIKQLSFNASSIM